MIGMYDTFAHMFSASWSQCVLHTKNSDLKITINEQRKKECWTTHWLREFVCFLCSLLTHNEIFIISIITFIWTCVCTTVYASCIAMLFAFRLGLNTCVCDIGQQFNELKRNVTRIFESRLLNRQFWVANDWKCNIIMILIRNRYRNIALECHVPFSHWWCTL